MRGVGLYLLAVEQKQVRDIGREEFFDLGCPVIRQCRFCVAVLENLKPLLAAVARGLPVPAQVIVFFGSFNGMAEGDLNPGLYIAGLSVNAARQIFRIGERAPVGAFCVWSEQDQLERIQERRFSAAVKAADQDDRLVGTGGGKLNALCTLIKPEIVQYDLVEYHLQASSIRDDGSSTGDSSSVARSLASPKASRRRRALCTASSSSS